MANSANPEINKKIATSALGTLVIATVFFYLGDRYAETLVTYPGQIFDHLSDLLRSAHHLPVRLGFPKRKRMGCLRLSMGLALGNQKGYLL